MKTRTIINAVILLSMSFFSSQLIGQTINAKVNAEEDTLNMKYEFFTNNSIVTIGEISNQMISSTTKDNAFMSSQEGSSNSIADLNNPKLDVINAKPNSDNKVLADKNKSHVQKNLKP